MLSSYASFARPVETLPPAPLLITAAAGSPSLDDVAWVVSGNRSRPVLSSSAAADPLEVHSARPDIRALPPAPPSAALALCAIAGLGLVRATRSLSRNALAVLPDWYHPGGPAQIGYTRLAHLEAQYVILDQLLCAFLHPVIRTGQVACPAALAPPPRMLRESRGYLLASIPRGPPGITRN